MNPELNTIILGLITTTISLFTLYYPEYRILILMIASISFIGYILFTYLNRIEKHENEIKRLKESLKRTEDLIEIRAEIKSIQKRLK
jgi:hypothetical protein